VEPWLANRGSTVIQTRPGPRPQQQRSPRVRVRMWPIPAYSPEVFRQAGWMRFLVAGPPGGTGAGVGLRGSTYAAVVVLVARGRVRSRVLGLRVEGRSCSLTMIRFR